MLNWIFRNQVWLGLICCLAIWVTAFSVDVQAQESTETPGGAGGQLDTKWIVITLVGLLLIVIGVIGCLFLLQNRIVGSDLDKEKMEMLMEYPFGVPAGTVRSLLALLIVTISLLFIVLQIFVDNFSFPPALTAVLGTVLGFYFGSRSSSKGEEALSKQVKQIQTEQSRAVAERDQAVAEREQAVTERDKATVEREQTVLDRDTGQAGELLKKVQKGLGLTKAVTAILPKDVRDKYGDVITKLEAGVNTAQSLTQSGNAVEAVAKATEAFQLFKTSNPVLDIVKQASQSFGRVLGGTVPPIAIIGAVIGVGAKLVGGAYQKWKARILHLPFSPAVVPLEVVDANTGFVLFLQSPIFKAAFTKELEDNNRDFMKSAVKEFLREENTEALWKKFQEEYPDRFESRDQFEAGLEEFRRAAANLEVKKAIDAVTGLQTELAEVGGYDSLQSSLDQIYADKDSRADLDALVTVVEGLQQNGEPVQSIFNKVKEEVSS